MARDNRKEPRPFINIPVNVFDGRVKFEGTIINLSGSGLFCTRSSKQHYNKGKLLVISFRDLFSHKIVHYLGQVVHDVQTESSSTTGIQFQHQSSITRSRAEQLVEESSKSQTPVYQQAI